MSKMSKKNREKPFKTAGGINHQKYISRITKTLYYTKLPKTDQLSLPVTELAAELFSETQQGKSLERLHYNDAAKISRNACVSPCSLVLALIYLEKLKTCDPDYLERTSPSDLFLVSLMVSCKFLFDDGENDEVFIDEWAASGGLTIKQLVLLEKDFLKAINWEIFVNELKFWKKLDELEKQVAKKQGSSRGYFTYTELEILLNTIELNHLIQCIIAISTILAATYAAGLFTIIGAVFLTSHIPGTCIQPSKTVNVVNDQISLQQLLVSLPAKDDDPQRLSTISDEPIFLELPSTISLEFPAISPQFSSVYHQPLSVSQQPQITASPGVYDNNNKTDCAVKLLNTGILLASINLNSENNNTQNITWDWWTTPSMIWLTEISQFVIDKINLNIVVEYFIYYLETSKTNLKYLELEDQEATKTRIQDQLETKWHKEWTDTIKNELFPYPYQNIK